jgi:acylpyruvate hydrolase
MDEWLYGYNYTFILSFSHTFIHSIIHFKKEVPEMKKVKIRNSNEEYNVGKIVCVGKNYKDHAEELGGTLPEFPLIFLKPVSAIIFSGDKVVHPSFTENLHYEGELVLLIGEDLKDTDAATAERAIIAYTVGLDMTARDVQFDAMKKGNPWTISKGFDTSAVLTDFVLKKDYKLTLNEKVILKVNGTVKQNSELNKMVYKPAEVVKYISSLMNLEKGDLIFTGTPAGVGRVVKGDKIEAEVTSVAKLETEIV